MSVDIALAITFLVSFAFVIFKVANKLPVIILIPDDVIVERLQNNSTVFLKNLLRLRDLYKRQKIQQSFWRLIEKTFYHLHIILMRADNRVVFFLKKIRGENGNSNGRGKMDIRVSSVNNPSVNNPCG